MVRNIRGLMILAGASRLANNRGVMSIGPRPDLHFPFARPDLDDQQTDQNRESTAGKKRVDRWSDQVHGFSASNLAYPLGAILVQDQDS